MKTLVLMRHAKTEGNNPHGDKARELLPRGIEEAHAAGEELASLDLRLGLVSPSQRTRQTFEELGLDIPVEYQDIIYEGRTEDLLHRIAETDDALDSIIMVGHAPTIPMLASHLTYEQNPHQADQLQSWFPAATFAVLDVDCAWSELAFNANNPVALRSVHRP